MNAPLNLGVRTAPTLATRLFALLAPQRLDQDSAEEALWLAAQAAGLDHGELSCELDDWQEAPPPSDVRLHALADMLSLSPAETIALALAFAADSDVAAGRALAWLQAPRRDSHPTLGLVAALEALPGWDWDPFQTQWERGFSVLTQFVANSGHARPSKSAVTGTYPLGEWVSTQRKHHHRGILSDARSARLEQLPGWRWIDDKQHE